VWLGTEALLADVEIVSRVERRRKWTAEEKAALLAEIDAEGGKVTVVARRYRIPESVLYNWRSARKAAMDAEQCGLRAAGRVCRRVVRGTRTIGAAGGGPARAISRQPRRSRGDRDHAAERRAGLCRRLRQRDGAGAGAAGDAEPGVISLAPGTKVFVACRPVDLRNGFDGLAAKAQEVIGADPFSGHLFIFRGKRGDYFKGLYWDGSGLWLIAKRLEKGRFVWPPIVDGAMTLTPAQFSVLIEAMDWRRTIAPLAPSRPVLV
jgi:transposase